MVGQQIGQEDDEEHAEQPKLEEQIRCNSFHHNGDKSKDHVTARGQHGG